MKVLPLEFSERFSVSWFVLVVQQSEPCSYVGHLCPTMHRDILHGRGTRAPMPTTASLSLSTHKLASAASGADLRASDRSAPYVDVRYGRWRQVPGEC